MKKGNILIKFKFYGFLLLLLLFSTPVFSQEIRLSVAGSLTDVIKDVVASYRQNHPQVKLLVNCSSSGALAKQIVAGAPADIYISANPKWMVYLQQQGMVANNTTRVLIYNSLVLVGSADHHIDTFADILNMKKVALGSPKSVPAGKYAEQALTSAGLYQQLQSDKKLVMAKNVRQALLYAERGEVDGAFVYQTDALLARQAKVLFVVPQEMYPQITYSVALLNEGLKKPEVDDFFNFLFSQEGQMIFQKYGFLLVE